MELLISAINSINVAEKPKNCNVQILVIANACTDATVSTIEHYQYHENKENDLPLLVEEELKPGKSYALNRAVQSVDSGYICFMDDDQRADTQYLAAITKALTEHPDATLLCGPLFPDWKGDEASWVHETGKYRISPPPIPQFDLGPNTVKITQENRTPPGGGHVIIRKDVFNRIGLFSEELGPKGHNLAGSEDTEFFIRAINQDELFIYVPDIIQYHYVDHDRLKLSYLIKNSFQKNRSLTSITRQSDRTPLYLYSKLTNYLLAAVFSFNMKKFRYYLIRSACILGQIAGYTYSLR